MRREKGGRVPPDKKRAGTVRLIRVLSSVRRIELVKGARNFVLVVALFTVAIKAVEARDCCGDLRHALDMYRLPLVLGSLGQISTPVGAMRGSATKGHRCARAFTSPGRMVSHVHWKGNRHRQWKRGHRLFRRHGGPHRRRHGSVSHGWHGYGGWGWYLHLFLPHPHKWHQRHGRTHRYRTGEIAGLNRSASLWRLLRYWRRWSAFASSIPHTNSRSRIHDP